MKRVAAFGFIVVALFAFTGLAAAGPTTLKAVYVTNDRVDLEWASQSGEKYKVWKSTNGKVWTSVYTFTTTGETSYSVTSGISPYINYYFNVTTDAVASYPADSTVSNSAYEVDAFPPNQHAHAYYASNTSLCKNCHNTHTSQGPKLLSLATVSDTCMSCHDGTGSKYDIINGMVSTSANNASSISSPAGPFGGSVFGKSYLVNEPESIHSIGAVINTAPGGNSSGTGQWAETLGCGSCHDAHGSTNYRMLKASLPYGPKITVKAYAYTGDEKEDVYYVSGMNNFCSGCHPAFNAASSSDKTSVDFGGGTVSGEAYRHSMGTSPSSYAIGSDPHPLTTTLPLEGEESNYDDNKIMCLTCHSAHGSNQPSVFTDANDTDGLTDTRNYLLRMENMGVCEDCHKL